MRSIPLAALLLFIGNSAYGQTPGGSGEDLDADYWFDIFYPKVFYTPIEGLTGGARYAFVQPLRISDYGSPPPYRISIALDGQLSTSGSRFLELEVRAPGLANGWRFSSRLMAHRRAKANYFGLGNATVFDDDNVTDAQPNFYRAIRTQYVFRANAQRDVVGPLRVVGGVKFERWRIAPPNGASLIAIDLANQATPTIDVGTNDVSVRLGLMVDTRDDEVAPTKGVVIEAGVGIADADVAGDLTYTRTTATVQGFWSPSPLLVLGARGVGQVMRGTRRFGAYYVIEGAHRFYDGLGGASTHRALPGNRFLGRDKLFGNFDARYILSAIPTLYRISLVGFLDAGRVFETENFRITTEDLHVGGGGGLVFQLGRTGVAGFTVGLGPDGVEADFHSRWTF